MFSNQNTNMFSAKIKIWEKKLCFKEKSLNMYDMYNITKDYDLKHQSASSERITKTRHDDTCRQR
uniref:Uncharacterized protein n=1 Tax=Rhizophagus irregularis (strain DAOM 181602 / DAOM 197198 / MUCL 43194) TaxID=747089 RepID=U9TCM1_RHIID